MLTVNCQLFTASAGDWPNFKRDAARTGFAAEQAYPPLSVAWTYSIQGEIRASAAATGQMVFLCARDGSAWAWDAQTGKALWDYSTDAWIDASPAYWQGKVYAASRDGKIYVFDAVGGDLLWTYSTASQNNSSPVVVNGILYITTGFPNTTIVAINAITGKLVWSQDIGNYSDSSPAVSAGVLVVGANNGRFYAYDAVAGNPRGSYQTGGGIRFSSMAISSVTAYAVAGDDDHKLYAFDISGSSMTLKTGFPVALDANPGAENVSSVVIAGNKLFVAIGVDPLVLHCRSLADGSLVWEKNIGIAPPGVGYVASPVVANDVIYAASGDGKLYSLKVADGSDAAVPVDLGASAAASPVVANGRIFIGTIAGKLYAFNAAKASAIVKPSDNEIIGGISEVSGLIKNPDFIDYKLEYGAGVNPASWTMIVSAQTSLQSGGFTYKWDTSVFAPGIYSLRLVVGDSSANPPDSTARVAVRIDQVYRRVYVDAGQGANIKSPDGTILDIPAGAMNQNDFVTLELPADYPFGIAQGVTATGLVRRFSFDNPATVLTVPATLTLPYKPGNVSGLNPDQLWFYRYDGKGWIINEITERDAVLSKLTTKVRSPGYYRIGVVTDLAFQRAFVSAQNGGRIVSLDGTVLDIPVGAMNQDDFVTVENPLSYPSGDFPQGVTAAGVIRHFSFDKPNTAFTAMASLTMPYKSSDLSGLNKDQLWIFRYDGQYWVINEATSRDTVNDKLLTQVKYPGYYRAGSVTDLAFQRVFVRAGVGGRIISLDGTVLDIPSGAMNQDDYVILHIPEILPSTGTPENTKPTSIKRYFEFQKPSTLLLSSGTLSVPYTSSDITGLGEEQLRLYHWKPNDWIKLEPVSLPALAAVSKKPGVLGTVKRINGVAPAPGYYRVMEALGVSAKDGGKYVSADGLEIIVEPGALSQDDSFNVQKLSPGEFQDNMPGVIKGLSYAWQLTLGKSDTVFLKPITLRFPYNDSDVVGIDENKLRVYWWDTTASDGAGAWRIVNNSNPEPSSNVVEVKVAHFTVFRVAAFTPSGPLLTESGVYTYPNPAPGDRLTFKTLLGDDADLRINIFNVAGDFIAELANSGTGGNVIETVWDISRIASGVYVYRVEATGKTGTKSEVTKKLAIIH